MPHPASFLYRISFPLRVWLAGLLFVVPAALLVICLPGQARRRWLAHRAGRILFRLMGVTVSISGLERLPSGGCIVVANHASYLDGPLLTAVLPPHFSFVIKHEITRMPLIGRLLARLGSEFVDRFDPRAAGSTATRLIRLARRGKPLGVFPEGTFVAAPGLRGFHLGAFLAAARAGVPVVPLAIRGTRAMLPANSLRPRAGDITVEIMEPISPEGPRGEHARILRETARACILTACGEPDALHPQDVQRGQVTPMARVSESTDFN